MTGLRTFTNTIGYYGGDEGAVYLSSTSTLETVQVVLLAIPKGKLEIYSGDTIITGKTQNTIVGQKLLLSASVSGPVADPAPVFTWTVDEATMEKFAVTLPTPNAPNSTSGRMVPFTKIHQASIDFAWRVGTFAGTIKNVKCTCIYGGKTYVAETKFRVYSPISKIIAKSTKTTIDTAVSSVPVIELGPTVANYNSNAPPGMNFRLDTSAVRIPPPFSGQFQFVQVVTASTRDLSYGTRVYRLVIQPGLDQQYPYNNPNSPFYAEDSPTQPMNAVNGQKVTAVNIKDSFVMYLMFRPLGGDWIPIRKVKWDWSSTATLNASSVWNSPISLSPPPDSEVPDAACSASDFPAWSSLATWVRIGFIN